MITVTRFIATRARLVLASVGLALLASATVQAQLEVRSRITTFDSTICGTSKCRPLVFKNVGAAPLTITSADAFAAPFALNPGPFNFPQTLQPGDSLRFNVCYSPTSAGRADTFKGFVRYDAASLDSFVFVGRSIGGVLSVTAGTTAYGTVQLFNTACLTVRLTNTGDAPLPLGPIRGVNPPFSVQTPPPAALAPGASADVTICFTPATTGAQSANVIFTDSACGTEHTATTTLTGTGVLPPKVTLGPVLQLTPDPVDFDTTLCGTTKCRTLTIRNIGSSPLNVSSIDALIAPFSINASTPLTLPFTLAPNETRSVQLCYAPSNAPRIDSQRVNMIADNRVSLSISMVFDTSGSMTSATGSGATRIQAANAGGKVFLDNLVNDPGRGIVDEAEVIRFSSGVVVAQGFTTNASALSGAVPSNASGSTRIYDALNVAIDELNTRNQPGRRVVVLLTDGDDDLDFSNPAGRQARIDAMVARAANNVRIFTIGLGNGLSANGTNTLQQLANRTNGSAFFTSNPDTLLRIYQTIAQELSRDIPGSFLLRGRSVAPTLTITPQRAEFDSVRVGNNRCVPVTLGNTGDAPLELASLPPGALGFTIQGPSPLPAIPPGGSLVVNACFAPTRLRQHDTSFTFNYNACRPADTLRLHGVGYDSVVIRITDSLVARPGTIVEFPIILENTIPVEYDVRQMSIIMSYNATLLFPQTPPLITTGLISSPWSTVNAPSMIETDNDSGLTALAASGGPIANGTPNAVLMRARFLALLGNAERTPVNITFARMADGNPKVGIVSQGGFRIDSICYLDRMLLDAHVRYGGTLKVAARSAGSMAIVQFTTTYAAPVQVTLYDAFGREVLRGDERPFDAGRHETTFDASALPRGLYLARVTAGGVIDGAPFIINR